MSLKNPLSALSRVFNYLAPCSEETKRIAEIEGRYEKLRLWRNELAKGRGEKPFQIFSNRMLLEIATRNPDTKELLLNVKGIGAKKLERFGPALLEALRTS